MFRAIRRCSPKFATSVPNRAKIRGQKNRLPRIYTAKNELIQCRNDTKTRHDAELKAIEVKHAEELNAIVRELAEITSIEQATDAFARKKALRELIEAKICGMPVDKPFFRSCGHRRIGQGQDMAQQSHSHTGTR